MKNYTPMLVLIIAFSAFISFYVMHNILDKKEENQEEKNPISLQKSSLSQAKKMVFNTQYTGKVFSEEIIMEKSLFGSHVNVVTETYLYKKDGYTYRIFVHKYGQYYGDIEIINLTKEKLEIELLKKKLKE